MDIDRTQKEDSQLVKLSEYIDMLQKILDKGTDVDVFMQGWGVTKKTLEIIENKDSIDIYIN